MKKLTIITFLFSILMLLNFSYDMNNSSGSDGFTKSACANQSQDNWAQCRYAGNPGNMIHTDCQSCSTTYSDGSGLMSMCQAGKGG